MADYSCEDDILCGVNTPSTMNEDEMSALEKKHAVVIDAPDEVEAGEDFEVEVRVGEYMEHPNEAGHFIEWMELYSGDTFLARFQLTPERTDYTFKATINLDHEHPIKAWAKCNLHGLWEGTEEIKVK